MIIKAEVKNVVELHEGFMVARLVDNELWYYGLYSNENRAQNVALELGGNAVVLKVEDVANEDHCEFKD